MDPQTAYNTWAATYDTDPNKTRDLEAVAIRLLLKIIACAQILELGCGTGKNTEWLAQQATHVLAVDFSTGMLGQAQQKISRRNVTFQPADITKEWTFTNQPADLVTCSLILEHIQELEFVFQQANRTLRLGGHFYVGELHPFRQYLGSKARFEQPVGGVFEVGAFQHHVSDYAAAAANTGFQIVGLHEWFDEDSRTTVPRILTLLFQKTRDV